jgi:hypothetical protein
MKLRRILPLLFAALLLPFLMKAQVTTSSITGKVTDVSGAGLAGATVSAKHVPSGTVYNTITRKDGLFDLPGLRIGGPYTVTVSFVGYSTQTFADITLLLGEPYQLTATMAQSNQNLEAVVVSGKANRTLKTGASTIVTTSQLATLPTINRSLSDYTRITPQANGNGFAGRDGRYNNLQIDGANLNNSFGLSTDLTPGGGPSPISVDAIQEVSVNIAPFDVRQSGFTGAGINAVTKSGTNTFHGTVYHYFRNQNMMGSKIDGEKITKTPLNNKIYGASVSGPIIKDKLFFFVNAEHETRSVPGITYVATGSNNSGTKSTTNIQDLKAVYDFVKSTYNYDPGSYDGFPNFESKNTKLLGKIDWNISDKHRLTVKYSDFTGSDISPLNGSSVPQNGKIFVTGQSSGLSRLPVNRFGTQSMAFSNSNYGTNHIVRTGSLELNSRFSNRVSNQLIATYTKTNDTRFIPGGKVFPTVDIFNGQGLNYISLGTDPFTNNNVLDGKDINITDNVTYYKGLHTITAGINYEWQEMRNMFMGGSNGHYVYDSLGAFLNQEQPSYYGYTYSLVPGQPAVYSADLKIGQVGIYIQDEFKIKNNFKLTYGIRVDKPYYPENPIDNPAIDALQFPDVNGNMINYNTGKWPKATLIASPRAGFNWNLLADKSLTARGGTGLFTGRIPYVFLTNMPSNNGMYQNAVFFNTKQQLDSLGITKFDPNPNSYTGQFSKTPNTTTPPQSFVVIDPKFKFPLVWRSNLGVDKKFDNGITATVDLIYTKDIDAVVMRNPNLKAPTDRYTGEDTRFYYPGSAPTYYRNLGTPIVLENTNKGYAFSATAQVSKSFSNGFYGSIAYTYTKAEEVSPNPGSRAASAWQSIVNVNGPNDQVLANSQYAIPHRILAEASYRFEYAKHFASTFSLVYNGSNRYLINYTTSGSVVRDGNSELMYIYPKGTDVPFVNYTVTDKDAKGNVIATRSYSIEQQQAAYDKYIASTSYLSENKGKYASRYGQKAPWFHELDFRFLEDLFLKTAHGTKHDVQFSMDIFNLGNLIANKSKNFGYQQTTTITNPLIMKNVVDQAPTFTWSEYNKQLVTTPFQVDNSTANLWYMQIGLRYSF